MIKNKLFNFIKKYSDEYLMDFNKNNLDISVLSGIE